MVPLEKVLTKSSESVEIQPDREYRQVTVRLWGGGVVLRNEVGGVQITAKRRYVVRPGQFLLSRIDARNGAFGLVPDSLDGAVVSNDFPAFDIDRKRLDPPFLEWMSKTRDFVDLCRMASEGTTNRVRLQVNRFLATKVPLPPLDEQRRIVARIEELAALIGEAQGLRVKAREEAGALANARAREVLSAVDAEVTKLRDWLDPGRNGIQTGPFGSNLGSNDFTETGVPVLTIGNVQYGGLHLDDLKHVSNMKAGQLGRYRIAEGDILFARMGTVGRCCVVPKEAEGWLINYHIIRVALDTSSVEPRFIHWMIQASPDVSEYLDENVRGATRKGVNTKIVSSIPCRVPSLTQQQRIADHLDNLQTQADELTFLQDATQAELDALLPSVLDRAFRGEL